jgi:excisionase family DNA binding protein
MPSDPVRLVLELSRETVAALAAALAEQLSRVPTEPQGSAELIGWREAGVPARTWRAAIKCGELPAVRVGRQHKVTRAALAAWLEKQRVPPKPPPPVKMPQPPAWTEKIVEQGDDIVRLLNGGRLRKISGGRK